MTLADRERKRGLGVRAVHGCWGALAALVLGGSAAPAAADTLGMIGDAADNSVIVFNADSGAVLATIQLDAAPRDVLVLPDQTLGFALTDAGRIFVIDLAASTPKLAEEPPDNPIVTQAVGRDLALSPDERYLLVSASGVAADEEAAVIDVSTLTELNRFDPDSALHVAVDVCGDRTVLVAGQSGAVSLQINLLGVVTGTGESLSQPATNIVCAPDSRSAVQVLAATANNSSLESFSLPEIVSQSQLTGPDELGADLGITSAIAFHPSGERLFVRGSGTDAGDVLTVFAFDPSTGEIGARGASVTTPEGLVAASGLDQIAVHPDGKRIYVPSSGRVDIHDSSSLALLSSISGLGTGTGTRSVALSGRSGEIRIQVDTEPLNGLGWLHPLRGSLVSVALLGSPRFAVASVDQKSVRFGPKNAKPLLAGQVTDANADGTDDLLLLFRRRDARIGASGVEHCASGRLSNKKRFLGCQWLRAEED